MTKTQKDISALSFEEALQELETVVKSLESGQTSLEHSVEAYERGVALKKHCEEKLSQAKLRIDKISVNKDGEVSLEEFAGQQSS